MSIDLKPLRRRDHQWEYQESPSDRTVARCARCLNVRVEIPLIRFSGISPYRSITYEHRNGYTQISEPSCDAVPLGVK